MEDVYAEALRLALIKKRTKKQVAEKLVEKGFEPEKAAEAAEYYHDTGYIDHRDYARRFTNDAVKIKGWGAARIKRELRERGVEDEIIEEILDDTEFDLQELMKKRFPSCTDMKETRKITDFYFRRGFSPEEIRGTIKKLYSVDGEAYE